MPISLPQPVTSAERPSSLKGLALLTARDDAASGGRVGSRAHRRRGERRQVNWEVFITCAVTGAGDTTGKSERVPISPAAIAEAAIEAAKAGAAIAHIHVRDPETGRGSRDPRLYREVVERVRSADVDVVLNLTAGMGGDLVLGGDETPLPLDPAGTDLAGASERLVHVRELLPEICTLDCGSMNFAAGGDYVMTNTPAMLRAMARGVQALGVRPGARGLRQRSSRDGQGAHRRRPDRRPGADPALHGHPLRRAQRHPDPDGHGQPAALGRDLLGLLDRPPATAVRRDGARWPAATCASGSRTTSTSRAACWPATASWSSVRSHPRRDERAHPQPAGDAREAGADAALRRGLRCSGAGGVLRPVRAAPCERVDRGAVGVRQARGGVDADHAGPLPAAQPCQRDVSRPAPPAWRRPDAATCPSGRARHGAPARPPRERDPAGGTGAARRRRAPGARCGGWWREVSS